MKKNSKLSLEKQINRLRTNRKNYPAGPSAGPSILKLYRDCYFRAIKNKKKVNALVLGATPELRDLVLSFGHNLTTIDFNIEAIIKMTQLMRQKNDAEIIIKGDWLKNPLKSNFYDVILGDGVAFIMPPGRQTSFLKEINRLLKKGGCVILREVVINPGRKIRSIEEIDKDYLLNKIHWFDMLLDLMFYSNPSYRWFNREKEIFNYGKFFEEIYKIFKKGILSKKSFQAMWWFKHSGIHRVMTREKFEKFLSKYFKLIPVEQTKEFKFSQDTLIFFIGKNKK